MVISHQVVSHMTSYDVPISWWFPTSDVPIQTSMSGEGLAAKLRWAPGLPSGNFRAGWSHLAMEIFGHPVALKQVISIALVLCWCLLILLLICLLIFAVFVADLFADFWWCLWYSMFHLQHKNNTGSNYPRLERSMVKCLWFSAINDWWNMLKL